MQALDMCQGSHALNGGLYEGKCTTSYIETI